MRLHTPYSLRLPRCFLPSHGGGLLHCCMLIALALFLSCNEEEIPTGPGPTGLDTTSHAVSWTLVDTLGDKHSYFHDVCAINDTCVYAVGILFDYEDTLKVAKRYNVARWDGKQWHRMAVHTSRFDGAAMIDEIRTVFAFGPDDVWITGGSGGYAHWDGKVWKRGYVRPAFGTINRIFGFTPDDIYFVCSMGGITRYQRRHNADLWTFIESGTQSDIYDIWGANDTILAIACDFTTPQGLSGTGITEILHLHDGNVTRFSDNNLDKGLRTIWFSSTGKKVVGGGWYEEWQGDKWWGMPHPWNWFTYTIRGNHDYDMWAVGDGSTVSHYNGVTWKLYEELSFNESLRFVKVACIPGQMWAVGGSDNDLSVVIHGRY